MHKEFVVKNRSHSIITIMLVITFMLYAFDVIEIVKRTNKNLAYSSYFIVAIATVLFIAKQYLICRTCYKYSIIANKLIINKIFRNSEENMSSISIKDIVYIGRRNKVPKEYKTRSEGKYSFYSIRFNTDCCVYNKNGSLAMFDFKPSEKFIARLKKYIEK